MVGSGGGVLLSSRKVGAVRAAAGAEQGEHVGSTAERPGTVSAHPDAPAQRGGPPSGDGDLQPAHPRWRRALRWVLALLAIAAISIATGIGTASAEGNLGPHRAQYDVTWDDRISVDLGPLGALVVDSPLPLSLGAHVVVLEIPWAQDGSAQPLTGQVLAADLDQYVQFFSAPQATIEVAARALAADAARRAAATGLTLTVIAVGGSRLLGRRRRAEIARALRPAAWPLAAGVTVVGVLAVTALLARPDRPGGSSSRVFDGTALEGAVITGRLSGVVDTVGGQIIDAYEANEAFYALAARNVRACAGRCA